MALHNEFHTELLTRTHNTLARISAEIRTEFRLPNGRIADIVIRTHFDDIIIVEVKSAFHPSFIEEAIGKYSKYGNYLCIALPETEWAKYQTNNKMLDHSDPFEHVGWITIKDELVTIRSLGPRRRIAPSLAALTVPPDREHALSNNVPIPPYRR